jgi:peptidoglycan/xylan/chitin deacetylase (PgdA/CDA1 family)
VRIAITVDVEKDIGFTDTCYGIEEGLPLILDLFRKNSIKATFFISSQAVEDLQRKGFFGQLIKDSHEIASHGYTHTDYRGWQYEEIKEEILKSKKVLEKFTGDDVTGYRSPQFLINREIIRAIKESGFAYDSSIPAVGGISAARMRRVKVDRELLDSIRGSGLREFPIDSMPVLKVPHGLLWINLISFGLYEILFGLSRKDFMVFYMHPFDLVRNKRRVKLDLKRKVFYLKNQDGISGLLENLIRFWISREVTFVRLEDEIRSS